MEYLGLWVTQNEIQTINKKVEAMVNMTPPKTTEQLHKTIGLVKYYRDIWTIWSHSLQPLIALTSNKIKVKWTDFE